ncbi:5-bromo-4-chloroindolyl phosphate hydrolysis family protein [Yoonia litorea]|uniref:5-bromo-4-chloroindolyl phosphate hydrolysis protein n=1 Tax=Yoonia litorea TaxID=1123755 RepID=A0A1I6LGZ5_9RHOB|nr:5-bromo-4-chloroindolyl phosphate hydrolysis family protein [Yoonia litorea]SFS02673.1 5-bromo-4-chloroindolyl phosphate hydrolysis protein [Yoonia litorea]
MAQRYGGKYSPDNAAHAPQPKAPRKSRGKPAGARARPLYLPGLILVVTSLGGGPVTLVTALVGGAVLTLAAWLLQEGLEAEAAYNERKVARRPAVPRKMLASALTGIGVSIAAYAGDSGIVGSALYGIAALALHVVTFGIDPLTNKRMEGVDTFQQDRVARVVDEAEAHLGAMSRQVETLGDRRLNARVDSFQAIARRMIRTVEEDPRDLTGARKYLGVYLMGARDATVKFVDLYRRNKDAEARAAYEALLDDLEKNFAARTERMMLDDRSDMDIEINVLRDRLKREGVHLSNREEK